MMMKKYALGALVAFVVVSFTTSALADDGNKERGKSDKHRSERREDQGKNAFGFCKKDAKNTLNAAQKAARNTLNDALKAAKQARRDAITAANGDQVKIDAANAAYRTAVTVAMNIQRIASDTAETVYDSAVTACKAVQPSPSPTPTPTPQSQAIVTDNFNSYAVGTLLGQGGWANYASGSNYQVVNSPVFEGIGATCSSALADSVIVKSGNVLTDGLQSFAIRTASRSSWGAYANGNAQVRVTKGPWASGAPNLPFAAVSLKSDGSVAFYNPAIAAYQNFATYSDGAWVLVDIQWRSSDAKARYRVNGGIWTDWYAFAGASFFTNFDHVGFNFVLPSGSGKACFDTLR